MIYGVQVFARAKVVPDLALSRGEEAHRHARTLGDRSLEFATAAGLALTYLELGELDEAERWLDRAAAGAAAEPTPLRARQLEAVRGQLRACRGDADGMREHLERAVQLATEQGRPAARCEALARLALEAAALGRGARRRRAARGRRALGQRGEGAHEGPAGPSSLGSRGRRGTRRRRPRPRRTRVGSGEPPVGLRGAPRCALRGLSTSTSSCRPRASCSRREPTRSESSFTVADARCCADCAADRRRGRSRPLVPRARRP